MNVVTVNDMTAPVNTVPASLLGSIDTPIFISTISVNDDDGNISTTQLTVTNGTVSIGNLNGAMISAGADGTTTLTLSGTQTQINAALATLSYQGDPGYSGPDTLTVLSTDGDALTDTDNVSITVSNEIDAQNDTATTDEDTPISIPVGVGAAGNGVLNNDTDLISPTALTVTEVNGVSASVGNEITLSSGALLTLNADGSYDYDPNGQFEGLTPTTDSFQYTVTDGNSNSTQGTVNITINNVNDASALDLNGVVGDLNYSTTFTEDVSGAVTVVDSDVLITDVDDTNIEQATLTLTNPQTDDVFAMTGS